MDMNNKGFAITGILYTLFVLFLLVLLSVLTGLSARKNSLERATQGLEESFSGSSKHSSEYITLANQLHIAPVDGKYQFSLRDGELEHICYAYLQKGTDLTSNITLIPNDCNRYSYELELTKIYSFEEE